MGGPRSIRKTNVLLYVAVLRRWQAIDGEGGGY